MQSLIIQLMFTLIVLIKIYKYTIHSHFYILKMQFKPLLLSKITVHEL